MPDSEFPQISRGDFDRALQVYLANIQEAMENKEWGIGSWMKELLPWADSPKEFTDKLYDEVMDVVDVQGVGPWVPHFQDVVGARIGRFNEEQLRESALRAVQESEDKRRWESEFGLAEEKFRYGQQQDVASRDWQRQQAALEARRWGMTEARKGTDLQREIEGAAIDRAADMLNRWIGEQQPTELRGAEQLQQQRQFGEQWEQMRETLVGSDTGGRNWIQREQLRNMPNPYKQGQTTTEQTTQAISDFEQTEKFLEQRLKDIDKRTADPSDPAYKGDPFIEQQKVYLRNQLNQVRGQKSQLQEQMTSQLGQFTTGTGAQGSIWYGAPIPKGFEQTGKTTTGMPIGTMPWERGIETPKWLPQFVPGLTGKYIPGTQLGSGEKAPEVSIPSGRQWAGLSPSRRQQWAGYAEFAGQKPRDILHQMDIMRPQELRLGRTWAGARARV